MKRFVFIPLRYFCRPGKIILILAPVLLFSCGHKAKMLYVHSNHDILYDTSATILFIPLQNILTEYLDDTRSEPDTQFTDSFFLEALNGLVPFELSQHFQIHQSDSLGDSIGKLFEKKASVLKKDTSNFDSISLYIYQLTKKHDVDLVAFPYSCTIEHRIIQPPGWRGGKYGEGHYSRPVSYTAHTKFHLQIWEKNGNLIFERIGTDITKRPVLYSLFKKEKGDKDINKFARRFYAPPLVRSLYKSVSASLVFAFR
ncbi:MAG: hypothetical protein GF350_00305 [Chitinivibrionales bacterium]|nr:hypothetical protein [Chitinivibrionales bacterium]